MTHTLTTSSPKKILIVTASVMSIEVISQNIKEAGFSNISHLDLTKLQNITSQSGIFRNSFSAIQEQDFDLILFNFTELYQVESLKEMVKFLRWQLADKLLPLAAIMPVKTVENKILVTTLKKQAYDCGITDFIDSDCEPFELELILQRCLAQENLAKNFHSQHSSQLEKMVGDQSEALLIANAELAQINQQMDKAQDELFERFVRVCEYRDDMTGQHTNRVGLLSSKIAHKLGLSQNFVGLIGKAAQLHDLGKIGIPDSILLKPGNLTEEERIEMQAHCQIGAELLSGSTSDLIVMAQQIAMTHHEKMNGEGYPNALVAEEIPIEGRIVAVADVFDALRQKRPYKPAWSQDRVMSLFEERRGLHFDVDVVDALKEIIAEHEVLLPIAI